MFFKKFLSSQVLYTGIANTNLQPNEACHFLAQLYIYFFEDRLDESYMLIMEKLQQVFEHWRVFSQSDASGLGVVGGFGSRPPGTEAQLKN